MQLNLYSAIALIGVVQGLFFAFTLWTKRKSNPANRFLVPFLLVFVTVLLDLFLESGVFPHYQDVVGTLWPVSLLVGPLFWWYTRSLTDESFVFRRHELRHLIPALIVFILFLPFTLLQAQIENYAQFEYQNAPIIIWLFLLLSIIFLVMIIHPGIYVISSLRSIRRYNRQLSETFSFDEEINLRWLNNLALIFLVIWVSFFFSELLTASFFEEIFDLLLNMSIVAITFAIGYFATRQPSFDLDGPSAVAVVDTAVSPSPITPEQPKYQSSTLSPDQASAIEQRLLAHMTEAKPYREGKLTLPQLAAQINVLPNYLSQVINESLGCNFFDFINQYRIADAQQQLLEEPNRAILDIALDAGFNSKSGFYKVFKQQAGMTPTQYRQSQVILSPE